VRQSRKHGSPGGEMQEFPAGKFQGCTSQVSCHHDENRAPDFGSWQFLIFDSTVFICLPNEVSMDWSERIGRRIRLRDLHILLAVVQSKSLAKAAEQLAISRPVVSKVIADLEHALGVRLLERDRHGAEPTIYGAALLKRGTTVFNELREGVKDIEFLVDPAAGEVRIGSGVYTGETFVTAVIERLSRRYPRIVFHLVTTNEADRLYRDLHERNVDFVIRRKGSRFSDEKLGFEILYDPSFVVVAGFRSPWARRRRIALAELADESWVLPPPEHIMGPTYLDVLRASGLDHPRIAAVATQFGARVNLVATGRFLTIATDDAFGLSKRPGITVLPIKLQHARAPVGIITLKNRTLSPVALLFLDEAREVAKPLASGKS
jgi:DNA-binding transcriptional LysR family regulator